MSRYAGTAMARIAIDIDSTIYDFESPMRQAFLELGLESGDFRGGYHSWVEWRSPRDVCGPEVFAKALKKVHSPEVILEQDPFPYAAKVIRRLNQTHDVFFLSNREDSFDVRRATHHWLERKVCSNPEVVCTTKDKREWLEDVDYLIDDRPKTLVEFVYKHGKPGVKAFGLMYPYNRALTDVDGIYLAPTWHGIEFYLKEKGVM